MPVFDYQCEQCKTRYEVYHKVKEVEADVVCPACGSESHRKLMSVPAALLTSNRTRSRPDASCERGACGCGGGDCGVN